MNLHQISLCRVFDLIDGFSYYFDHCGWLDSFGCFANSKDTVLLRDGRIGFSNVVFVGLTSLIIFCPFIRPKLKLKVSVFFLSANGCPTHALSKVAAVIWEVIVVKFGNTWKDDQKVEWNNWFLDLLWYVVLQKPKANFISRWYLYNNLSSVPRTLFIHHNRLELPYYWLYFSMGLRGE